MIRNMIRTFRSIHDEDRVEFLLNVVPLLVSSLACAVSAIVLVGVLLK